jgi:iron(III) transport system substrate-binding protein
VSTYFIESAQEKLGMFKDLTFDRTTVETYPAYYAPILANTGSLFVNTAVLADKGLPAPASIADLADPIYKDYVSIPNVNDSSTAWLFVQAIIAEYGEEQGAALIKDIVANVGPHLESSGSGPLKKIKSGEVAVGYGIRHQGNVAIEEGLPVEIIDPLEGNYALQEGVGVVNRDGAKADLAMKMAEVIVKDARAELLTNYPVALYEGETVTAADVPTYPKTYSEPLTEALLTEHRDFFNNSK